MSKMSVKRSFESIGLQSPQTQRCPNATFIESPQILKRHRVRMDLSDDSHSDRKTPLDNPFVAPPAPHNPVNELVNFPKPKKEEKNSEPLYTKSQVDRIVKAAVEEAVRRRDEQLSEEFSRILQDKLREQFENFNNFNHDYISRQFKLNECSYLS